MHVILTLEQGGAQEVIRALCAHAPSPDVWRVPLVVTFEDGAVRQQLERLGVRVEVLGPRQHGIESLPAFFAEGRRIKSHLAELIEEEEIDLVQTHLLETLDFHVMGLLRTTRASAVVWTIHNVVFLPEGSTPWLWLKQLGHKLLYRHHASRVAGIVVVSADVEKAVVNQIGAVRERVTLIPNAVDLANQSAMSDKSALLTELGIGEPATLALAVGRIAEQKGYRFLVEAATAIVAERPEVHFVIAGDGPLREDIVGCVDRAGLRDRFHFLGVRDDVSRLLASCDLFVMPSLWEGLSIALLEAMAAEIPIIATSVSGTVQAMVPDETGLLVPPADATSLADAILRVLDDPEAARERGQRARRRVEEHFGVQAQVEALTRLYARIGRAG